MARSGNTSESAENPIRRKISLDLGFAQPRSRHAVQSEALWPALSPCSLKAELQAWLRCVRGLLVRSSGFGLHWVRAAWRLNSKPGSDVFAVFWFEVQVLACTESVQPEGW